MATAIEKTERFQLRLDAAQRDALRAFCEEHRVTGSDVIRAAIQVVIESGKLPQPEDKNYQLVSFL